MIEKAFTIMPFTRAEVVRAFFHLRKTLLKDYIDAVIVATAIALRELPS